MDYFAHFDNEVEDFKQKKLKVSKERKGAGKTTVEEQKESTGSAEGIGDVNEMAADEGNIALVMGNDGCEDEGDTGNSLDNQSKTQQPIGESIPDGESEMNSSSEEIKADGNVICT